MNIPGIYGQRDGHWGWVELGWNTDAYYNFYHFGCAITGAANILWWITGDPGWDPIRVNQWLKDNGGYVAGGGLIIWGKLAELMRQHGIEYHGFTTNLSQTNDWLRPEADFAIAQLSAPGFPMHFSAMPFTNYIADSWDATLKVVTTYHFVGAHLFSKLAIAPVPVPEQSPAPIQAVVPAPLPEPIPEPAPSTTTPQVDPNPQPQPVPMTVQPSPGYGSGAGEGVPVSTPPVATPVLEDLPPQPEWVETFKPFLGLDAKPVVRDVLIKMETAAFDMSGVSAPKHIAASMPYGPAGPFKSTGTFSTDGKTYYRGTSGGWFGVPAIDVASDTAVIPPRRPKTRPSALGAFLRDPLGWVVRLLFRGKLVR